MLYTFSYFPCIDPLRHFNFNNILWRVQIMDQQDATLYNTLYYCQRSTCFERRFPSSSGAQICTRSVRYLPNLFAVTAPFYLQLSTEHVTDTHCGLCQHSTVICRLRNSPLPVDCSVPLPYLYYSEVLYLSVTSALGKSWTVVSSLTYTSIAPTSDRSSVALSLYVATYECWHNIRLAINTNLINVKYLTIWDV